MKQNSSKKKQPSVNHIKIASLSPLQDSILDNLNVSSNIEVPNENSDTVEDNTLEKMLDKKKRRSKVRRTVEQRAHVACSKIFENGRTYYKCLDCGKVLSTSYNLLTHRNTHTGERPYICSVCNKGFPAASGLNRHVQDVHIGLKKYACDICGRCLSTKSSRDEHRLTHTGERPHICEMCGKSFKQKASLHVHKLFHTKNYRHRCSNCNRGFRRKQELEKHVLSHEGIKHFARKVCANPLHPKDCVKRHIQFSNITIRTVVLSVMWQAELNNTPVIPVIENGVANEEDVQYIECTECNIIFSDTGYLINHMNTVHDIQVHYCPLCKVVYRGEVKEFEEHLSAHSNSYDIPQYMSTDEVSDYKNETNNKTQTEESTNISVRMEETFVYTCHTCQKSYKSKADLKKHISTHSDYKRVQNPEEVELVKKARQVIGDRVSYKCDICNKHMFTKRGFLRHIRVHSGKRPCTCDLCGKSYRIEQDLARHIRDVHEGVKKYACDICGRAFANKGAKDDHRRIHTGERPYACEHCPKTFRTLNSIYIHNRVHTNYKPHMCSYCGKFFGSRQRLTNHVATHTGVKPFSCEICGKSFSVKGEVVRHRAVHNQEKPFDCKSCGMKFGQKRYLKNHIKQHHKEESVILLAGLVEVRN